ncbi:hypothetical protein RAA17_11240 [Komagataeibacter rhaeticus]|nr:hypothetical protein [Komagataeibacter rhaeticus]
MPGQPAFRPYDSFTQADFASRDLYRKAVEELARGSALDEMDIAARAVDMARAAQAGEAADPRRADPGYYLLMAGRPALEAAIHFRPTLRHSLVRHFCRQGIMAYSMVVTGLTLAFMAIPLWLAHYGGTGTAWLLPAVAFIPVSEAAVACVNRLALEMLHATSLPGLEFRSGIPSHLRSMVVIPALLVTKETVAELLARIEVHYLATRDISVCFALLTDWTDHDSPHAPGDEQLVALAQAGWTGSMQNMTPPHRPCASICSTAGGYGARAKGYGWAGNANAASCTNSTACCAARPTRLSSPCPRTASGREIRHHA